MADVGLFANITVFRLMHRRSGCRRGPSRPVHLSIEWPSFKNAIDEHVPGVGSRIDWVGP